MHALTLPEQAGPLAITLLYFALYYATQLRIMRTKIRLHRAYQARGERFDRYFGQDREMLAADRAQLNLLEHMPPFLWLMWLHAVFVSPLGSTVGGAIYLGVRLVHLLRLGARLGRDVAPSILLVTGPGYLVLGFFLLSLGWALIRTLG